MFIKYKQSLINSPKEITSRLMVRSLNEAKEISDVILYGGVGYIQLISLHVALVIKVRVIFPK